MTEHLPPDDDEIHVVYHRVFGANVRPVEDAPPSPTRSVTPHHEIPNITDRKHRRALGCRTCARMLKRYGEPCKRHGGPARHARPAKDQGLHHQKSAATNLGLSLEDYQRHVTAGEKWCSACKKWQPLTDFGVDKTRGLGRMAQCREAKNAEGRARWRRGKG